MNRRKLLGLLPFLAAPAVLAEDVDFELIELIKNSDCLSYNIDDNLSYVLCYYRNTSGVKEILEKRSPSSECKFKFSSNYNSEIMYSNKKYNEYKYSQVLKALNSI